MATNGVGAPAGKSTANVMADNDGHVDKATAFAEPWRLSVCPRCLLALSMGLKHEFSDALLYRCIAA